MNVTADSTIVLPELEVTARPAFKVESGRTGRPQRLSPAASLTLDVIRFLAALTVALGHFTYPVFSAGLPNLMAGASAAVGVFFVLSGFIIRYVTLYRESHLSEYLADRASRLYSVVLPALGFTVVADLVARHTNHEALEAGGREYLLHIVASLSFLSESWFHDLPPYGNGPFWSLSFEAFYYLLYGLAFYLRGWKRITLLLLTALLAGPAILMLAPIWFLGSYVFDTYQKLLPFRRRSLIVAAAIVTCGALALGAVVAMPHSARLAAKAWAFHFNLQLEVWKFYRVSTWYYEAGIPAALALLTLLLVFDPLKFSTKSRAVRVMRYVADGTFPLYLFHFPMLLLIRAVVPYNRGSRWQLATVFLSIVVISIVLGGVCNKLKDILRAWFLKEVKEAPANITVMSK